LNFLRKRGDFAVWEKEKRMQEKKNGEDCFDSALAEFLPMWQSDFAHSAGALPRN
jgi:hypothetical protein